MPKIISIIVPTYNMQKYLRHCLDSLLVPDKLLSQLEVLVINDGSKDDSSPIAHEYETKYPNTFRVIDKENSNYGSCINRGLKEATGKYVKVLDADDSFDKANFENYIQFLSHVDVDMIISPFDIVNESGEVTKHERYDLTDDGLLTWQQLTLAFKKKALQMHAVTYKLQNLLDIHYKQTEGISYTDQEWIFTPLIAVNSAIVYPNTIYKYLVGREGQTVNPDVLKRNVSHNEQCCRRIVKDYKSFPQFESYKKEYLDYKFLVTTRAMYDWYLLRYTDLDIKQLIEFDDFVKSVDEKYLDLLDTQVLSHTCYKYILLWHSKRDQRKVLTKLMYRYSRILDRMSETYRRITNRTI